VVGPVLEIRMNEAFQLPELKLQGSANAGCHVALTHFAHNPCGMLKVALVIIGEVINK
jgi:hypothetical protein